MCLFFFTKIKAKAFQKSLFTLIVAARFRNTFYKISISFKLSSSESKFWFLSTFNMFFSPTLQTHLKIPHIVMRAGCVQQLQSCGHKQPEKEEQQQKPFEYAPENVYTECLWPVSAVLNGPTIYNMSMGFWSNPVPSLSDLILTYFSLWASCPLKKKNKKCWAHLRLSVCK